MTHHAPHTSPGAAPATCTAPLASVPVAFFDPDTRVSALAVQHLRADGRTALVYHDAPGAAAVGRLLAAIAQRLLDDMAPGHVLSLVETGMPEHPAERFVYAQVTLSHAAPAEHSHRNPAGDHHANGAGIIKAASGRTLSRDSVARTCGITPVELVRTEEVVAAVHRPRGCAFYGFRELALGGRARGLRPAA